MVLEYLSNGDLRSYLERTRDNEFTAEFTKEINNYLKVDANMTYGIAIGLVGAANIDEIIMAVAGADGAYVS